MEQTTVNKLLSEVSEIKTNYEKRALQSGESFNIFNILGMSTKEVKTHSAFLAELLNPDGSHGQGIVFLKCFLDELKCLPEGVSERNLSNAKVIVEKHIGTIPQNQEEGGNIDIIIEVENFAVIIENKINAGDQPKQLLRYWNYGNKQFPENFRLLYLTLNGKEASEGSTCGKKCGEDYFCISYKDIISSWLEKCIEAIENKPLVGDSVKQYSFLIKQLTNQTTNHIMTEDIANTIAQNEDYISALFELSKLDVLNSMKKELMDKFWSEFSSETHDKLEHNDNYGNFIDTESNNIFSIINCSPEMFIEFYYVENIMYIYLKCSDENKYPEINQKLEETSLSVDKYIWAKEINLNWQTEKPWIKIKDGSLVREVCEIVQKIIEALNATGNMK